MSGRYTDPNEPASGWGEHGQISGGLTKREAIAIAVLQGIRASMTPGISEYDICAEMAVEQAYALIKRLNK